jgi:dihydroorotase
MIRIKGGRVIDPANGIDKVGDIFIKGGKIVSASAAKGQKATEIDAKGKLVVPGLIDMHVHLREPGFEYKETIASGCEAAAAGGFTTIVCMPNTRPTLDNASTIEYVLAQAVKANGVTVLPMGAITVGLNGEELSEIGDMVAAGAVAITDDGKGLQRTDVARSAFEYAKNFGVVVCAHAEDMGLAKGGVMHEGEMSTRLGMPGIPALAESLQVVRDIALAEYTESRYHVQHISTRDAIDAVRAAKKKNLAVTCEAAPHHFTLTDAELATFDTIYKVNPPLRSDAHVKAVRKGLKDGTIDAIATDHAPHAEIDKLVEFDQASFGMTGLETALPLSLALVREGVLEMPDLIAKFTANPARILKLVNKGHLAPDADADVTIIDPDLAWTYKKEEVRSKSLNSPWLGKELLGRAVVTIAGGKIVHQL